MSGVSLIPSFFARPPDTVSEQSGSGCHGGCLRPLLIRLMTLRVEWVNFVSGQGEQGLHLLRFNPASFRHHLMNFILDSLSDSHRFLLYPSSHGMRRARTEVQCLHLIGVMDRRSQQCNTRSLSPFFLEERHDHER